MFVFALGRRGPAGRGMSREDIEATYSGWTVTDEKTAASTSLALKADPRLYRLLRL
jgi:hypothetical protein